jgi:hypothetical protein
MKRFLTMSALAVALAGVPTQQAAAWINLRFGAGINFDFQFSHHGHHGHGGWESDEGQHAMHGGHHGHHAHHGGHRMGLLSKLFGHRQQLYIFPGDEHLYAHYFAQPNSHDAAPQQQHQPMPKGPGQKPPFPPPPQPERKGNAVYQNYTNYNYPYLGYSVYQPMSWQGYSNYYAPTLRFDQ